MLVQDPQPQVGAGGGPTVPIGTGPTMSGLSRIPTADQGPRFGRRFSPEGVVESPLLLLT